MKTPSSPHFQTVDLASTFNSDRTDLPDELNPPEKLSEAFGQQVFRGIPFLFGKQGASNVLHLCDAPIEVLIDPPRAASYVLFFHLVGNRADEIADGLNSAARPGDCINRSAHIGGKAGEYTLLYADGGSHVRIIERRIAVQQARFNWGASPMAAVAAVEDEVLLSSQELTLLQRPFSDDLGYGARETRTKSGRDISGLATAWIYALPNPEPERQIIGLTMESSDDEILAVYAISTTQLTEHPLRPGIRRKLLLSLPDQVELNTAGEIEEIGIDIGSVISARAALTYNDAAWLPGHPDVQPQRESRKVLVEYSAHSAARLYVGSIESAFPVELAQVDSDTSTTSALTVAPAERPVRIRVVEHGSSDLVAVRFHAHGEHGEYLPPKGYHRKVNQNWFEDNYAEFSNGYNQYAYIPGECTVDLPLGKVFFEVTKGYEVKPQRTTVMVNADTTELTIEIERVLDWRARGWITADTHVHFLSPQTALLEGAAEGVNVVNLLASQWGEMFSNVGDFDGRTTFGAEELAQKITDDNGHGSPTSDFVVRVGTENRMQVLGHISLLGYQGSMIQPLCTGGPSESAVGDPQELTMAQWAQQCIEQKGLVVLPHAPDPQCERAADIVLDLVHATEMMTFNPCEFQINPYGITDWYRYLNLGYRLPLVGGSDKMTASCQLGGVRTYAQLGNLPFTYENWMTAVKAGHTFVTVGPLVDFAVAGQPPGQRVDLAAGGGTVDVTWHAESVSVLIATVEIVVGGLVHDSVKVDGLVANGSASIYIDSSSWVAVRVRGGYRTEARDQIAAHTSAVQVFVDGARPWVDADANVVLAQIEGALAYVDTLAPRPAENRHRKLRATLESAYNRFHQMMHRHGVFHDHSPVHSHHEPYEH